MTIAYTVLAVIFSAIGVFCTLYGLFFVVSKIWTALLDLTAGLKSVGQLAETNQKLVEIGMMVAAELTLLRSTIGSQSPGEPGQPPEGTAPTHTPGSPAPFPQWNQNVFVPVTHEAELDDTVIDDTDDERMVKLERVEELRTMGVEVDPSELEEG